MKELAQSGMTMVVVTHEMGFAKEVASRVIFIDEGKIQEENKPKEFFENPKNQRLRDFCQKYYNLDFSCPVIFLTKSVQILQLGLKNSGFLLK